MTDPKAPVGVDFVARGTGPAILYVPGSFSTPSAWRAVQAALPGYRHVATSLCGYGGTEDRRDPDAPGIAEQIDVLETCAARIGTPFHLVGHSFGGTIALAALASGRIAAQSLITFEANPFFLLRDGPRDGLVADALRVAAGFETAQDAGDPDAAGRIINYWGGAGSFAAMPDTARAYCRATARTNVLDWRSVTRTGLTTPALAALGLPCLVVRGQHANPAMRATTDLLAATLPDVKTQVIAGASHFPITTHAAECAGLIAAFLSARVRTG